MSPNPSACVTRSGADPERSRTSTYLGREGHTSWHQINGVPLPWSVEIVSNSPAMAGNILAQGDGDFIGCRITADGAVKTEKTASQVSAYVYCLAKSA